MDIIITILAVIAILAILLLIAALLRKKEYSIKREISIQRPGAEVFHYVKFLKNQDFYSKWVMMDPHLKKDFKGTDGTIGFVYAWEGNQKAGKGEQEIKTISGHSIGVEIRFIKPFEGVAQTLLTTESLSENQTKVIWEMNGQSKYPFNLVNIFLNNMLGNDFLESLSNLKYNLEKQESKVSELSATVLN